MAEFGYMKMIKIQEEEIPRPTKIALSRRERQVLDFIAGYIRRFGINPTQQEIADAFGRKRTYAQVYLRLLIKKGYLRKINTAKKFKHRHIEIVQL